MRPKRIRTCKNLVLSASKCVAARKCLVNNLAVPEMDTIKVTESQDRAISPQGLCEFLVFLIPRKDGDLKTWVQRSPADQI